MNDVAESIDDACAVEVEADGFRYVQRIEAGAIGERWSRLGQCMPAERLEKRMARRDPFEVVLLGGLALRRETRITVGQGLKLPVGVTFVAMKYRRRRRGIEGVRQRRKRFQTQRHKWRGFADETSDCFRDDAALLCEGAAFDEHLQVESFGRQPLQRVLADSAEMILAHVAEQSVFQIVGAEIARVIFAQDAFDVSGGENFADHVEDRVVVQRLANLVELFEQLVQDAAFHRVRGDKVEDQTVRGLAVAVDSAHPLLKAIGIPRNIVIEEDVAALKVDALAGGLGGDEYLDRAFAELLLGVKSRALFVTRCRGACPRG